MRLVKTWHHVRDTSYACQPGGGGGKRVARESTTAASARSSVTGAGVPLCAYNKHHFLASSRHRASLEIATWQLLLRALERSTAPRSPPASSDM